MTADGVRELLRIKLKNAGHDTLGKAAWAMGICEAHLCGVLSGKDKPGPKVLKWLGLKRVFTYEHVSLPELHERLKADGTERSAE